MPIPKEFTRRSDEFGATILHIMASLASCQTQLSAVSGSRLVAKQAQTTSIRLALASQIKCQSGSNSEACDSSFRRVLRKVASSTVAAGAVAAILFSNVPSVLADTELKVYYGTAASASSYGGYGGNSSKIDTAEYVYSVPVEWKERNISKVEKGTNGTDSEFFNPKKRTEKTYLTFLAGMMYFPSIMCTLLVEHEIVYEKSPIWEFCSMRLR